MQDVLRPTGTPELEELVREALGDDAVELTQVGRRGNVSVLYRYPGGVAKVMAPTSPFWTSHHEREMAFYRHTGRFPCREVRGNVILMHYLEDGYVPDQVAGLELEEMRRIVKTARTMHQSLQPWAGMARVNEAVLGFAHELARPLLAHVTVERLQRFGVCRGREEAVVRVLHHVMDRWDDDIVPGLEGTCVVHGDLRGENVFLPNGGGDAVLLDWQLACVGSPFVDLAYLLSSSMTPEAREAHERELLEEYCGGECEDAFWAKYREACRWPAVWAVFVFGGGLGEVDVHSDSWGFHRTMAERYAILALDTEA